MTIAEAIAKAAGRLAAHEIEHSRLDAEVLLGHLIGRDRAWLLAHGPDVLDVRHERGYDLLLDRRAVREPIQYITGVQEFWGLPFTVTPDVLIPRPETELVVEAALRTAAGNSAPLLVDLCTGSGCIAISLANELQEASIIALDRSAAALDVARRNARQNGVEERIRFLEGDLFAPLAGMGLGHQVDVITANPPYVREGDLAGLQPEVRDFEPELALIAGPRGTEVAERIVAAAPDLLRPGGVLILEMGMGQAPALSRIIEGTGTYGTLDVLTDLAGIDRVIVTKRM